MKANEKCLAMIRRYEGYHEELPNGNARAYRCPAGVLTVGYGSTTNLDTNMPIREGEVVTKETAERWLRKEADTCATAVAERYPLLNENQAAAITSLCFNAGVDCIGETLGAALKSGDWQKAGDTLLEYHHADGEDVEGLKNRRKAERKIFDTPVGMAPAAVEEQVAWLKIYPLVIGGASLIGVAANRDTKTLATWTGTDRKAMVQFMSRFPNANNVHFANTAEAWPGDYVPTPTPKPVPKFPLAVPFFPQLDNPRFPSGTCNVTSVAMVLAYFGTKPQDPAEQLEMEVLRWMESSGLDRHVHVDLTKAIQHYGYKNTFSTEATIEQIKKHLDLGFPCIVSGMFTSAGHIIVLTGYDSGGFWVNDPFGEWCSAGYEKAPIATRGKGLHYSFKLICNVSGGDGSIWCHFPSK